MKYKIYNLNELVSIERTIRGTTDYFKKHHPNVMGFGRDNISRKLKKGDVITKQFRIEKIEEPEHRAQTPKKLLLASQFDGVSGNTNFQRIVFDNELGISTENIDEFTKYIMDKIKKLNINLKNNKLRVSFLEKDGPLNYSTQYLSYNNLIDEVINILKILSSIYDSATINRIVIEWKTVSEDLGDIIVFGNKERLLKAHITYGIDSLISNMYMNKKAKKKIIDIFKNSAIVSPATSKNCLIKSCYIARYKNILINGKVEEWIKGNNKKVTKYTPNIICNLLCKTLKRTIKVYILDDEPQIKKYKFNSDSKEISIVIFNGHSYAVIDNKNLVNPEEFDNVIEEMSYNIDNKSDVEKENKIEKPEYKDKMSDYKICTFDLETCDSTINKQSKSETKIYALGFYDGEEYKEFYNTKRYQNDIVQRFIRYITFDVKHKNLIIYSHNGGKFDIWLLIRELISTEKYIITSFLENSGRILNIKLCNKKKTIIFRDSINFINMSLNDACESFKPKTRKLEGDVNHDNINIDNSHTNEIYNYTRKYLENDCKSLLEIIEIFDEIIKDKYKFSIKDVLTNASIARRYFLESHYDDENKPIYTLDKEMDEKLRKYYYGGRNECMQKLGYHKGKFYYFDFTSLYPYVMSKYKYPHGKINKINVNTNIFNNDWFGFVKCRFRHIKKDNIPLHAVVNNSKLIFPYCDNWQESILSTEEIKYSLDNNIGYEYEYETIYNYKNKSEYFKNPVDKLYEMKIKAEKDNNPALRAIAKIIINSLYGFFGIKYLNRDQTKIVLEQGTKLKNPEDNREAKLTGYLLSQKLKDYRKVGKYDFYTITDKIKPACANVGIASMVTSYARIELYKLLKDIKEAGGNIYYMDTDSVITDYNIYENKEMIDKWIRSGGEKLGELTNETKQHKGYYTELITLGNKMYALRNEKLEKENKRIVLKLKGININNKYDKKIMDGVNIRYEGLNKFDGKEKATFDDYIKMSEGYNIFFDNMSFISGVNDMLMNDKKLIKLRNKKKIHKLYDKGVLDKEGNIKPHTF